MEHLNCPAHLCYALCVVFFPAVQSCVTSYTKPPQISPSHKESLCILNSPSPDLSLSVSSDASFCLKLFADTSVFPVLDRKLLEVLFICKRLVLTEGSEQTLINSCGREGGGSVGVEDDQRLGSGGNVT